MSRSVAPRRVAAFQRLFLQRMGASPREIRRYLPILTAQIGAESHFTEGIGSPAGARDIAQFMPGTASSYGVRLGDNRIRDDIRGQVRYMLPLLRKHGVEGALRGYNAGPGAIEASKGYAETNAYVQRILGSAGRYRGLGGNPGSLGNRGAGASLAGAGGGQAPGLPAAGGQGAAALLAALTGQQRQMPTTSAGALAMPSFAAGPRLAGVTPVSSGGPAPKPDVGQLLSLARSAGEATPGTPPALTPEAMPQLPTTGTGGAQSALEWASSKVGFRESGGENRGGLADRLNKRFGMSGQPWCAMFTSAAVVRGGAPLAARTASVAEVRRKAAAGQGYVRGLVSRRDVRPGDLILFGNSHIGMVRAVRANRVTYVGGNQSDGVTVASTTLDGGDFVRPRYGVRRRGR